MPRREPARKSKQRPRARPASAAVAPPLEASAAEVPQPSQDNQALISHYLKSRDLRPNTRAAYRADLWTFATALGPQSLLDVRADDVQTWMTANTRDPAVPGSQGIWGPRTAARKLATLKAFYGWCRETPAEDDPTRPLVAFSPVASYRTPAFERPDPVRLAREALRALFDWWEARITACEADGTSAAMRERDLHVLDVAVYRTAFQVPVGSAVSDRASRTSFPVVARLISVTT